MWLVGGVGGGLGGGGMVVRPSSPRPPRRRHRGSMPAPVSGKTARGLQQRGAAAGGEEDRVRRRGGSDGDSCVCEDRWQVSNSTGGLSGELVGGMKHGLELGGCVLRLPPRGENLSRGNPGV